VQETKTVASKTQGTSNNSPEVWTTHYLYDTWGRLQQMAYPDGEVLTYAYDSGGLVRAATGVKLGVTTPYVQRLEYDEFGQRAFLLVGNGADTAYAYNPLNRRLSRLTAGDFQDLNYDYDLVGNITALSNKVPVPAASDMGGPVDQTFTYDGLYRLTQATGEWRFSPNKRNDYSLSLAYDTIHNITRKTQSNAITTPGGATVPQKTTTYDFPYAYAGRGPHAPTIIGERAYSYDGNGNQTGYDDLTSGRRRTIVWDEENRVRQISDNGRTTAFVYDDAGERVIKRGAQGETAYVNQFWTVRNRSVGTKHFFVVDTRIASKVVPGDAHVDPGSTDPFANVLGKWWQNRSQQGWQNGNNTVKNPHYAGNKMPDILPEDNFVYFYHPDHLGSTSFATAATGDLYEHLEYFPFGETWVSEQSNTQRLPNLFTSKELDEETQLYYFGARYYDARLSLWLSVDPELKNYLTRYSHSSNAYVSASTDIFTPKNLDLYSYAWNNPMILRDPTGRKVELIPLHKDPVPTAKETRRFQNEYNRAKAYLGPGSKIEEVEKDKHITIKVIETEKLSNVKYYPSRKAIYWNPHSALSTTDGGSQSPAVGLDHEADHTIQNLRNPAAYATDIGRPDPAYDNKEERRVITGSELRNVTRLGEGVRHDHSGSEYRVDHSDNK